MTEISKSLILIYVACGNVRCYKAICQRCWNMFRRAYFLKMFFLAGFDIVEGQAKHQTT